MPEFESVVGINPLTALATLVNMIITFLVLKKFLFKPVKKMIDDRQSEIDGLFSDAAVAREEAGALKAEYEQRLQDAKRERDEIIRAATVTAREREKEIIDSAKADAAAIMTKAEADIAQEKKKALNDVKSEISGIAMEIASRVVRKEIDDRDHRELVEEFIGKIGDEV